ncbi:MAG: amidase family protein, partial [Dehalococcoidia bacterium]
MVPTLTPPLTAALALATTVAALRSGSLSLPELIEEVCARMGAVEPQVRAVLPERGRRERLLREAEALARRYPDPGGRPVLFGALVGVKDIFAVEGFEMRAGSALPPELFAGDEAESVRRLRAAGALVLGKTVNTEFAFSDPGATANPHNPAHTPGGSSSGSAAAVAAGIAALALGSQTVGSVIRPASFCGVVGVKPSYGRIPYDGVLYFSESMDHVGFFT